MKIVIAGAGAVGTHLSKLLSTENHDCVLIDDDEERLSGVDSNYDIMAVCASPTSIQTLKDAGTGSADLFVGVTRYESRNITACMMAHSLGAKKTVARIDNYEYLLPQNLEMFRQVGVDSLVYPEVLAATDIINGLKLSWVRQRWDVHDGALVLMGIKLRDNCQILDQPIKDLCGPDDPYHIVALKRGGETIIPGGLDMLKSGDLAYFMTTGEYIPHIKRIVGKGEYEDVPTFIYSYDTIHDPKYLMANYRDLNGTVKSDKEATDLFYESAQEIGVHCVKGWVPPFGGATDNAAFNKAGFRCAGITGLNHNLEDYYHTRRDTYDNLNEEGLQNCFAASVKVLEKFDNGAKQ